MSKINVAEEIAQHNDEDIIEFLYDEMRLIRRIFTKSVEAQRPEVLYTVAADVSVVSDVLAILNRRTKEKEI